MTEELKAAFEAATPGEWRIGDAGMTVFGPRTDRPAPETVSNTLKKTNAAFITLAHNTMPVLLEALALLGRAVSTIEAEYPEDDERYDLVRQYAALREKLETAK